MMYMDLVPTDLNQTESQHPISNVEQEFSSKCELQLCKAAVPPKAQGNNRQKLSLCAYEVFSDIPGNQFYILSLCNGLPSIAVATQFFGMPALESTSGILSHQMPVRQAEQMKLNISQQSQQSVLDIYFLLPSRKNRNILANFYQNNNQTSTSKHECRPEESKEEAF